MEKIRATTSDNIGSGPVIEPLSPSPSLSLLQTMTNSGPETLDPRLISKKQLTIHLAELLLDQTHHGRTCTRNVTNLPLPTNDACRHHSCTAAITFTIHNTLMLGPTFEVKLDFMRSNNKTL